VTGGFALPFLLSKTSRRRFCSIDNPSSEALSGVGEGIGMGPNEPDAAVIGVELGVLCIFSSASLL